MKVYYLHHSAVCAVFRESLLVFDYFMHEPGKGLDDGFVGEQDLREAKRVYVFVSHAHPDHFNPLVYEWAAISGRITYIMDETVPRPESGQSVAALQRGGTFDDGYIHVQAFGSTDTGGSFLAACEGTSLFHAGDLNDWHWKDEGNARYSDVMHKYFVRELAFIRHRADPIDCAFFPVDKRMGTDYDQGADLFIRELSPKVFIPIHFVDFSDTQDFADKHPDGATMVLPVHRYGERLI